MPGQNFDSKRRITVRNLRIREDTAKVSYLHPAARNFHMTSIVQLWNQVMYKAHISIYCVSFPQYLRNLDPNSAYYDPKTRAMRENPYANTGMNPDE